jgi:selenocysteine-specific elongation factor
VIVATAGHVDHGKTTLVKALTGVDTDRLPEEKRRGMSIDLGFAYLPIADALPIAFVDVPGHERFVRNMAAGIQSIDIALLVVAADDGPMPQTLEHLAILRHRGVQRLVVALTKVDRVPAARRSEAATHVAGLLRGGPYEGSPLVEVSTRTGEGVSALRQFFVQQAEGLRRRDPDTRPFRLNADRVFVLAGLGVIVTGTVVSGCLRVGDNLTVLPRGLGARVRSLHVHDRESQIAHAGERCALALQGISRDDVKRGDVLAGGDLLPSSKLVDIVLRLEGDAGLPSKRRAVQVLAGTADWPAQLSGLETDADITDAGERLARLTFPHEVSVWHGYRLLLRDPSTGRLVGGGEVIDPIAPNRGSSKPERLDLLRQLRHASAHEALEILLGAGCGVVDPEWLARSWHVPGPEMESFLASGHVRSFGARRRYVVPVSSWQGLREALESLIADHHAEYPGQVGPSLAAIRDRFAGLFGLEMLVAVLDECVHEERFLRTGGHYRLPTHKPALAPADEVLWAQFAPLLSAQAEKPPRVHELSAALAIDAKTVEDFLVRATLAGRVFRVARNRFFPPETVERMVAYARQLHSESPDTGFTAAQFRDRSGLGRNLTIEVLEYLDHAGYTRRSAERRRLVGYETEEKRTPVGRPDFKPGERRLTSLAGSTPASSAT